jgi:hypothetical protein
MQDLHTNAAGHRVSGQGLTWKEEKKRKEAGNELGKGESRTCQVPRQKRTTSVMRANFCTLAFVDSDPQPIVSR